MSDMHGCYDEFIELITKIKFNNGDKLYILGDVIDRGEEPIKLLKYIKDKNNITLLLGNHEDMMIDALSKNDFSLWFRNGGYVTHEQFMQLNNEEKIHIKEYLQDLKTHIILNDYWFLSHAGLDPNKELSEQDKDDFVWTRKDFYRNKSIGDYFHIFGHTPTVNIHGKLDVWFDEKYQDKMCIDCGVIYGGKLACIELQENNGFEIYY